MRIDIHHHFQQEAGGEILAQLDKLATQQTLLRKLITMNQAENVQALTDVKATLIKVGGEIDAFKTSAAADSQAQQAAIAALETELANSNALGLVSPEAAALLGEIKTLALGLDAKIDDLPSQPPAP